MGHIMSAQEEIDHLDEHIAALHRVMACLLDHYLACYDGARDSLALEAEELVPDWKELMDEWKPKPRQGAKSGRRNNRRSRRSRSFSL